MKFGVSDSRALTVLLRRLALVAALLVVGSMAWESAKPVVKANILRQRMREYHAEIVFAANESGLDPNLLAAMMRAESSGRLGAISHKGALGLFQLMLSTAIERADLLGLDPPTREDLITDPMLNARLGANYMVYLIERDVGGLEGALVSYNTGPFRLARWVREAGSYAAWREERMAAGNSDVLAYAAKVLRYRDEIAENGYFESTDDGYQ
ncbi:MAG: soluble lytic murein transglycosylase-like protein [Planctomycetota bacterium]|jgi:soluble lytic murein transglycosylase-like protein